MIQSSAFIEAEDEKDFSFHFIFKIFILEYNSVKNIVTAFQLSQQGKKLYKPIYDNFYLNSYKYVKKEKR